MEPVIQLYGGFVARTLDFGIMSKEVAISSVRLLFFASVAAALISAERVAILKFVAFAIAGPTATSEVARLFAIASEEIVLSLNAPELSATSAIDVPTGSTIRWLKA